MSFLDTYRAGALVPFSGIYRVFHGQEHADPHCVTLIEEEYFPQCNQCASLVHFELIFHATYGAKHIYFSGAAKPTP